MADREKVIKAIEACMDHDHPAYCQECYLDGPGFGVTCRETLMRNALALLREQEPVEPKIDGITFRCGSCNSQVWLWATTRDAELFMFKAKYCPNCGKAVKWNADLQTQ